MEQGTGGSVREQKDYSFAFPHLCHSFSCNLEDPLALDRSRIDLNDGDLKESSFRREDENQITLEL